MNRKFKAPIRLQGTDGIRREIRHSKEIVPALSPQEAFLEQGFLTEEFMELYAYAQVSLWLEKNETAPGKAVVVGWDPRDPSHIFTQAVVQGIRRAGASACILGIVPTPLVPLYMVYAEAMGGLMVTASHNPPDQNGIKIFNAHRGLKPFPLNDEELSRRILELDYKTIRKLPLAGRKFDHRKSALELFHRFSLASENSWIEPDSVQQNFFKNTLLVVDPANGSLSGLAAEIFRTAGFSNVYELNGGEGEVNSGGGVADLEGWKTISAQQAKRSGPFFSHNAVRKLFELGRKHKARLLKGTLRLWGAVSMLTRIGFTNWNTVPTVIVCMYWAATTPLSSNPGNYSHPNLIRTSSRFFSIRWKAIST
jgi:phosphoglucosamine mutase